MSAAPEPAQVTPHEQPAGVGSTGPDATRTAVDAAAVAQLVLLERQGRDRGWFDQEASCFADDSLVRISWFEGPGKEFVRQSRGLFAAGLRPNHTMGSAVVHVEGDRAVAEIPATISIFQDFDGVGGTLVNDIRLLYRARREDGVWLLAQMDCIYERDTVVATNINRIPQLDERILERFREPYRYLGYHLHLVGKSVRDDLYGDDCPERVDALYAEAFAWLRGVPGPDEPSQPHDQDQPRHPVPAASPSPATPEQ